MNAGSLIADAYFLHSCGELSAEIAEKIADGAVAAASGLAMVVVGMVHLVVRLYDDFLTVKKFLMVERSSYRPGEIDGGDVVLAAPDDCHVITS